MYDIMKTRPFSHQLECFDRFKDSSYAAILGDMGTGKTKMAIDIMAYKHKKGLHNRLVIIAPVIVGPQWVKEQLPEHCGVPYEAHSYKSGNLVRDKRAMNYFLANCRNNDELMVLTINYEAFVRNKGTDLVKRFVSTSDKPPAFIIDEASRIKNPEAKSVINIMRLRLMYPGSWRCVMTGTPAAKSPVDMWSIFNFLKAEYMGCSYLAFQHFHEIKIDRTIQIKQKLHTIRTNIDPYMQRAIKAAIRREAFKPNETLSPKQRVCRKFGLTPEDYDLVNNSEDFVRFKNVDKLKRYIAKDSFSISKDDCLDLPEKIYKVIQFEMNADQKKLIRQLAESAAAEHDGEYLTISTKALLGMRILQICGGNMAVHTDKDGEYDTVPISGPNPKLQYILNDMEEAGDQQAIVWASFKAEIALLTKELGKKFSVRGMSGETPKKDRPQIVEDFKNGEAQILVAHPAVGGYGMNFQMAGIQYWYSRDYRTASRMQAEDRSHRIGTTRSPIYKDLLYNSGFEKKVLDVLKEGADMNAVFVTTKLNDMFQIG